ncbi:unnamed protein product [Gongylonema pulchrum]|uniref:DNA primase n=1 Tax=Gongylonema pulchrum TaxID=637853 RepID=A0A183EH05_9BILA|nr:unnamed protein product [Gongylonema pulchrum]
MWVSGVGNGKNGGTSGLSSGLNLSDIYHIFLSEKRDMARKDMTRIGSDERKETSDGREWLVNNPRFCW